MKKEKKSGKQDSNPIQPRYIYQKSLFHKILGIYKHIETINTAQNNAQNFI